MQTATSVSAVMIATTVLLATSAEAGRVRVSQELEMATGAKEFVVKGFVETFDLSDRSPADVYAYNVRCEFSYGGTDFLPKPNATVMAVFDMQVDMQERQTLFTVHGYPDPACGGGPASGIGQASMSFTLKYDDDGMECLLLDDDPDLRIDSDTCDETVDSIDTTNGWNLNLTDGFVLGWLDGWWQLDASYESFQNIDKVIVRSSDDRDIIGLGPDETIRLENVLEVGVDVQPGTDVGCLNSDGNGVIPVAILGTPEFDVSDVDRGTLRFAGLELRVRGNGQHQCSTDYIDDDDYLDLICHFYDDPEAWTPGTGRAGVSGEYLESIPFFGDDAFCVAPRS